jgi:hypothetical protein
MPAVAEEHEQTTCWCNASPNTVEVATPTHGLGLDNNAASYTTPSNCGMLSMHDAAAAPHVGVQVRIP